MFKLYDPIEDSLTQAEMVGQWLLHTKKLRQQILDQTPRISAFPVKLGGGLCIGDG